MKNISKIIIAIVSIIVLLDLSPISKAGVMGNEYPICSLAVFPYNTSASETTGSAGDPYINKLDSLCSSNLTYPTGAATKFPESSLTDANTPFKSVESSNKKVPIAYHDHIYYNDSVDNDGRYHKSLVKAFQITLQEDADQNISTFYCDFPYPGYIPAGISNVPTQEQVKVAIGDICKNWKGTKTKQSGYIANLWGGTKIEYDPAAKTITWIFAVDNNNWYPFFYGNNRSTSAAFDNVIGVDSSNKENRKFKFEINLETLNQSASKKIWAATTTSKVLLRNLALDKNAFQMDNSLLFKNCSVPDAFNTGWCSLPPIAGHLPVISFNGQNLPTNFFWFDIGNVVSIWKTEITPPPTDLACTDLQWDGPFLKKQPNGTFLADAKNPNALLENQQAVLKVKPTFQSGAGAARPLEYHWVSFAKEADRPAWFPYGLINLVIPAKLPLLLNALPLNLLNIAHAAPIPAIDDLSITNPDLNPVISIFSIGKFKDESNSGTLQNPLIDDDVQSFYNGGNTDVILGVQAFYADGKNIPGQGNMIKTSDGKTKQIASNCHKELTILPPPPVCTSLDLSYIPNPLKPNTPVTFTVTPHFTPSNQSIDLNYAWEAKGGSFLIDIIGNLGDLIGGSSSSPAPTPTIDLGGISNWGINPNLVNGLGDLLNNSGPIVANPCDITPTLCQTLNPLKPLNPVFKPGIPGKDPIINPIKTNQFKSIGGANIFGVSATGDNSTPINPLNSYKVAIVPNPKIDTPISPTIIEPVAKAILPDLGLSPSDQIDKDNGATIQEIKYGGFKDYQGKPAELPTNPYTETNDKNTWYTGGPSGTHITVQGIGKDGTIFPNCKNEVVIPAAATCQQLKVNFLDGATPVESDKLKAGTKYKISIDQANSKKTDGSLISQYTIKLNNPAGAGSYGQLTPSAGNAPSCSSIEGAAGTIGINTPTSVNCYYDFTPNENDHITILADPQDGVAACQVEATVAPLVIGSKCKTLGLNPLLKTTLNPGDSVDLSATPTKEDGTSADPIVYEETGDGNFIADLANVGCPAVPASSNALITFTAPHTCKYSYKAGSDASSTITVHTQKTDGVADCTASFTVKGAAGGKTCSTLNLKVNGLFNNSPKVSKGNSYSLNTSPIYNDSTPIAFVKWSVTGSGKLINNIMNPAICQTSIGGAFINSSNSPKQLPSFCQLIFVASTDSDNFTAQAVPDDSNPSCNAASTNKVSPPGGGGGGGGGGGSGCTVPPSITKISDTLYCSKYGDSKCLNWKISGASNPLFNNGYSSTQTNGATHCVDLKSAYADFTLSASDCTPTYANFCSDVISKDTIPTIEKSIAKDASSIYGSQINYSTKGKNKNTPPDPQTVKYKITFIPENYQTGTTMLVNIYDPAFTGKIQGYKTNSNDGSKKPGGTIDFSKIATSLQISGYPLCKPTDIGKYDQKCYDINPDQGRIEIQGINSSEPIIITYKGVLNSGITTSECQAGTYCNERFINQSSVSDMKFCTSSINSKTKNIDWTCTSELSNKNHHQCVDLYNEKDEKLDTDCKKREYTVASQKNIAELACQYFLSRASGDVFLEDQLTYGTDISKCYPFKNVSDIIAKPIPPKDRKLGGTGAGTNININHEICSAGQKSFESMVLLTPDQIKELQKIYGSDISKLSSQICEVGLVPGIGWSRDSINQAISQNIGKLTRWATPSSINSIDSYDQLVSNLSGNTLYFEGNDLNKSFTINREILIPDDSGAKTIIIKNADLIINKNIIYKSAENYNQGIASLGVIVINGNIKVAPEVSNLAGAYFVQREDPNNLLVGNIYSTEPDSNSDTPLTINGSVYGNIGPLFEHRIGSGDVAQDQGAITIRYDQRMIQNTPPGLTELFGDFNQSQIAQ